MKFPKLTIKDVPIENQTVLVKADYNVPLDLEGNISDDFRIRASVPTLKYLLDKNCKIVIISHLGRPDGRRQSKYSLKPVAESLSKIIGREVTFVDECIGDKVSQAVKKSANKSIILLENLRFHKQEEEDDEGFAKQLAVSSGARYFVQDGFAVAHRAHASIKAITNFLPSVAGLLLEEEYVSIKSSIDNPKEPLIAVVGGAKIKDKIGIIKKFIDIADKIIIGGAMANTFLAYKGINMRDSIREKGQDKVLDDIYKTANKKSDDSVEDFIILPSDAAVAKRISTASKRKNVNLGEIEAGEMMLDIGEKSIQRMVEEVSKAGTVIWNGTLGYAELPEFAHGSARLAMSLATQPKTVSVIGGGDTADFALKWDGGSGKSFTHVSTGGGAGLELMSGQKLPGIEALLDAHK